MQLLTRLVLDRIRVGLQPVHVPLQQVVFALQALHLLIQAVRLLPFPLIRGQPIRTEDDVISDRQGKRRGSNGRSLPPATAQRSARRAHYRETHRLLGDGWVHCHSFSGEAAPDCVKTKLRVYAKEEPSSYWAPLKLRSGVLHRRQLSWGTARVSAQLGILVL
jgi:hypothetical protein